MDSPNKVVEDDGDIALRMQIEAIKKDEELRQIAERDEALATREQCDQFIASNRAALLAVQGEDYARQLQAGAESKGIELYTQYPHLDVVKGDNMVGQGIVNRPSIPPAAAAPVQKARVFSTPPGSPSHSPAGSPRVVGGIKNIKIWNPFGFGNSGKQEKSN